MTRKITCSFILSVFNMQKDDESGPLRDLLRKSMINLTLLFLLKRNGEIYIVFK